MSQDLTPPRVVILGAGYAGSLLIRALDADAKAGKISLYVVERRDGMHHKIGAIRASVQAGEWTDRIRIPLSRITRHAKVVLGDVETVDEENKQIKFKGNTQDPLTFDLLVCATGTLNHSPGDLPPNVQNKDEVRDYFTTVSKTIKEAKDVLIVGGGASAVEYAGEIRAQYPDKPVTILCSASHLLSSSVAPLNAKFLKTLYETLEAKNIKLIRGEKCIKPTDVDFGSKKYEKGPMKVQTKGEQNLEIETDLLLWAASWTIPNNFYPAEWINELGELNIRSTFQLLDRGDVFAFGDVCSLAETKQAITLPAKIPIIRANILAAAKQMKAGKFDPFASTFKGMKNYRVTDKVTMYLPVGPTEGVSQIGKSVYGGSKTSKFKGKDLYTEHFWKLTTGGSAPNVVE